MLSYFLLRMDDHLVFRYVEYLWRRVAGAGKFLCKLFVGDAPTNLALCTCVS